ncbi:transglutaminase [Malaciobacter pacificus]|uniref:Transglutaminase family protein n=1 Tax=Malaciobacter pacificus TaxID=1080223 RepID=A0A5C2H9M8_9BACT|nr:transglutaminase family protein [Malaciobacter pacificus]QEP35647.1 transglutaminase family protein [Malaciobacter pacificus]GGD45098.1 transglutaminase [Malaciobacter pacificus]
MIYEIFHETTFEYDSLVTFSHNIARLKPKKCDTQEILDYNLEITPKPFEVNEFKDYFENKNSFMLIREAHKTLNVTAKSKVFRDVDKIKENEKKLRETKITVKEALDRLSKHNKEDALEKLFLIETNSIPNANSEIKEYILEIFKEDKTLFNATNEFMSRIFKEFKFVSGFSDITTPIETIFKEKKGVCQDFAQFAISALRGIGIPTRYVSGYIQTYPQEGQEKLFGADASHAWFSIYIPGFGWADFDPTNNKIPNEEYIILGYGRDYNDIAPLKGVVQSSGQKSKLNVRVNVERLKD